MVGSKAAFWLALPALATLLSACGDQPAALPDAGPQGPFRIQAASSVAIKPSESRALVFTLLDEHDHPLPDHPLQFQIVDPQRAKGATLSSDHGTTSSAGEVSLQVIAGVQTSFIVRASTLRADDFEVLVLVTEAINGPVEVVPEIDADPMTIDAVTSVRVFFLSGSSCSTVSRLAPGEGTFKVRTLAPGATTVYPTVSTEDQHAIVGHGIDATGALVVDGCVDLPGSAVLAQQIVRVPLPLRPPRVSPAGSFRGTSLFLFRQTPKSIAALGEAWKELTACSSDPGRLWLDCTIDAFSPASAADPLDCRPSAADEMAFDGKLAAKRGLLDGTGSRCRGPTDAAGRAALESQIAFLFGNPRPPILSNLSLIVREAGDILRTFKIHSSLQVTRTSSRDRYQVEHRLEAVELMSAPDPIAIDLLSLGLPARVARFVPAVARDTELAIAEHGFSLRLGTAARLGFERSSLARRGYPASTSAFVTALFGAAAHTERGTTFNGCFALSALVCPMIAEGEGCLVAACTAGTAALGRRLENAFAAVDGDGLDLSIEGTAPIVDRDGDGRADALGWLQLGSSDPGVWSGQLRTPGEQTALQATWTADRVP
jgi:hypothetical protein